MANLRYYLVRPLEFEFISGQPFCNDGLLLLIEELPDGRINIDITSLNGQEISVWRTTGNGLSAQLSRAQGEK